MYNLKQLYTQFEDYRKGQIVKGKPSTLYEPFEYLMNLGGKRIRPIMTLAAYNIFQNDIREALNAAYAVEVFHNFSLAHDDIMDDSFLRRNQPTMHVKYNVNTAILSGDLMLIYSYKFLEVYRPVLMKKLILLVNKTSIEVCEGQRMDMDFEEAEDVTIDDYITMITLKTSVLLASALKVGFIIGGADETRANHIYEFGKNLGIAFQIQDDILDTFGDSTLTGKKVGGDIVQNKKTYLYLKALELLSEDERAELMFLYKTTTGGQEKIDRVLALYKVCHVRVHASELKDVYHNLAMSHLDAIEVDDEKKEVLRDFALSLLNRDK